jgi:lipopolysaccharide biosynthesis regulator YciM
LGEAYESRGERDQAIDYHSRLVDLWEGADPELQTVVSDVRQRIARLVRKGNS